MRVLTGSACLILVIYFAQVQSAVTTGYQPGTSCSNECILLLIEQRFFKDYEKTRLASTCEPCWNDLLSPNVGRSAHILVTRTCQKMCVSDLIDMALGNNNIYKKSKKTCGVCWSSIYYPSDKADFLYSKKLRMIIEILKNKFPIQFLPNFSQSSLEQRASTSSSSSDEILSDDRKKKGKKNNRVLIEILTADKNHHTSDSSSLGVDQKNNVWNSRNSLFKYPVNDKNKKIGIQIHGMDSSSSAQNSEEPKMSATHTQVSESLSWETSDETENYNELNGKTHYSSSSEEWNDEQDNNNNKIPSLQYTWKNGGQKHSVYNILNNGKGFASNSDHGLKGSSSHGERYTHHGEFGMEGNKYSKETTGVQKLWMEDKAYKRMGSSIGLTTSQNKNKKIDSQTKQQGNTDFSYSVEQKGTHMGIENPLVGKQPVGFFNASNNSFEHNISWETSCETNGGDCVTAHNQKISKTHKEGADTSKVQVDDSLNISVDSTDPGEILTDGEPADAEPSHATDLPKTSDELTDGVTPNESMVNSSESGLLGSSTNVFTENVETSEEQKTQPVSSESGTFFNASRNSFQGDLSWESSCETNRQGCLNTPSKVATSPEPSSNPDRNETPQAPTDQGTDKLERTSNSHAVETNENGSSSYSGHTENPSGGSEKSAKERSDSGSGYITEEGQLGVTLNVASNSFDQHLKTKSETNQNGASYPDTIEKPQAPTDQGTVELEGTGNSHAVETNENKSPSYSGHTENPSGGSETSEKERSDSATGNFSEGGQVGVTLNVASSSSDRHLETKSETNQNGSSNPDKNEKPQAPTDQGTVELEGTSNSHDVETNENLSPSYSGHTENPSGGSETSEKERSDSGTGYISKGGQLGVTLNVASNSSDQHLETKSETNQNGAFNPDTNEKPQAPTDQGAVELEGTSNSHAVELNENRSPSNSGHTENPSGGTQTSEKGTDSSTGYISEEGQLGVTLNVASNSSDQHLETKSKTNQNGVFNPDTNERPEAPDDQGIVWLKALSNSHAVEPNENGSPSHSGHTENTSEVLEKPEKERSDSGTSNITEGGQLGLTLKVASNSSDQHLDLSETNQNGTFNPDTNEKPQAPTDQGAVELEGTSNSNAVEPNENGSPSYSGHTENPSEGSVKSEKERSYSGTDYISEKGQLGVTLNVASNSSDQHLETKSQTDQNGASYLDTNEKSQASTHQGIVGLKGQSSLVPEMNGGVSNQNGISSNSNSAESPTKQKEMNVRVGNILGGSQHGFYLNASSLSHDVDYSWESSCEDNQEECQPNPSSTGQEILPSVVVNPPGTVEERHPSTAPDTSDVDVTPQSPGSQHGFYLNASSASHDVDYSWESSCEDNQEECQPNPSSTGQEILPSVVVNPPETVEERHPSTAPDTLDVDVTAQSPGIQENPDTVVNPSENYVVVTSPDINEMTESPGVKDGKIIGESQSGSFMNVTAESFKQDLLWNSSCENSGKGCSDSLRPAERSPDVVPSYAPDGFRNSKGNEEGLPKDVLNTPDISQTTPAVQGSSYNGLIGSSGSLQIALDVSDNPLSAGQAESSKMNHESVKESERHEMNISDKSQQNLFRLNDISCYCTLKNLQGIVEAEIINNGALGHLNSDSTYQGVSESELGVENYAYFTIIGRMDDFRNLMLFEMLKYKTIMLNVLGESSFLTIINSIVTETAAITTELRRFTSLSTCEQSQNESEYQLLQNKVTLAASRCIVDDIHEFITENLKLYSQESPRDSAIITDIMETFQTDIKQCGQEFQLNTIDASDIQCGLIQKYNF